MFYKLKNLKELKGWSEVLKQKKRIKLKESNIIALKKVISIKVNRYDWAKCMTNAIKY
tara:strand:- start:3146 stop:3319 length:174 start_codon:yes stop_codon:yes gene_type:complete